MVLEPVGWARCQQLLPVKTEEVTKHCTRSVQANICARYVVYVKVHQTHTDSECTRMDQVGFSRKETVRVTSNKHKQLDKIEVGRTDGCRCDTTKLANTPTGCRIFPKIIYRCTFHRHTMWRRCKATIHGAEAA